DAPVDDAGVANARARNPLLIHRRSCRDMCGGEVRDIDAASAHVNTRVQVPLRLVQRLPAHENNVSARDELGLAFTDLDWGVRPGREVFHSIEDYARGRERLD